MSRRRNRSSDEQVERVERALRRCLVWSRSGRHRKVITEIDCHLAALGDQPHLTAVLLVWKAHALLAVGMAEPAHEAALRAWELEPSPHACHLAARAHEALGDQGAAEELLRMGWCLFAEALHLPVQLAVLLADQGRLPEALEVLAEVPVDGDAPADLKVFLFGMKSNLLAAVGRWAEADELLQRGMDDHPGASVLSEAHASLLGARRRAQAEKALAASWGDSLGELAGIAHEVDEAVVRCGAVNELSELVVLAARRLWRGFLEHREARPQAPEAWGAALVFAVLELDGCRAPVAPFARSFGCNASSVRAALARFRAFIGTLDVEFARRAFAAHTNPRLDGPPSPQRARVRTADVVPFPAP